MFFLLEESTHRYRFAVSRLNTIPALWQYCLIFSVSRALSKRKKFQPSINSPWASVQSLQLCLWVCQGFPY